MLRLTTRLTAVVVGLLVAAPTLAHVYGFFQILSPTTVVDAASTGPATTDSTWRCLDSDGAQVGVAHPAEADAQAACKASFEQRLEQERAAGGPSRRYTYAIERADTERVTTTTVSRTVTHELRGTTSLELTAAEAQLVTGFDLDANDDGTLDTEFPGGDKPPSGGTLSWNFGGSPFLSPLSLSTGTPYTHNARQYGGGTLISGATLSIVHVSGDNAATEGWAISGNNLTHPGDNPGSGVFKLRLTSGMTTADSPNITWAYTVPVGADYSWTSADGLDNGTGAGNWVPFNGATLNADPAGDGYLQVTFPSGSEWGGISSHHAMPSFTPAGVQYDVEVVVAGGSNVSQIVAQIGLGTGFTITGTGTKTFQLIGGSGNQVLTFHANGTATAGQVWRISSITINGEAEVFNFTSSTVNVNEDAGTAEIGVNRNSPSNSAATIDVVRTVGNDGIAIVVDDELSWAANEGGNKFSTLNLVGPGSVTLQLQNASVGAIGSVDEVNVTVQASTGGGTEMRRPAIASWWSGGDPDLGDIPLQQFHPTAIARFARSHSAIINWIPEYVQWFGISSAQEFIDGFMNWPGARLQGGVYVYLDIESVYKEWFTTGHLAWQQATQANNWYVYLNGATGTPQDSYWAPYLYAFMVTNFANRDAQGRLPTEWWADYAAGYMHNGEYGTGVAPGLAGIAQDNAVLQPRRNRDWNRDGTTDNFNDPAVGTWWRQGIITAVNRYKANNPGRKVVGNIAEFIGRDIANDYPEFCNLYDGGLLEHVIAGREFSAEVFMDTPGFVASMQAISDCLIDPQMLVLSGYPEPQNVRDIQQFRHGLAITMVITDGQLQWGEEELHYFFLNYDEYAYDMGLPTEPRKTAPTQNGVWERDYFNGTDTYKAVWWPKGVTGTLNLGGTWCALDGEASAWLSDGQQVTSVTAPSGRNGIFLVAC